jgi:Leucine-rich repeat (LRR) protein
MKRSISRSPSPIPLNETDLAMIAAMRAAKVPGSLPANRSPAHLASMATYLKRPRPITSGSVGSVGSLGATITTAAKNAPEAAKFSQVGFNSIKQEVKENVFTYLAMPSSSKQVFAVDEDWEKVNIDILSIPEKYYKDRVELEVTKIFGRLQLTSKEFKKLADQVMGQEQMTDVTTLALACSLGGLATLTNPNDKGQLEKCQMALGKIFQDRQRLNINLTVLGASMGDGMLKQICVLEALEAKTDLTDLTIQAVDNPYLPSKVRIETLITRLSAIQNKNTALKDFSLDISRRPLEQVPLPHELALLTGLTKLILSKSNLTPDSITGLTALTNLTELDVSQNEGIAEAALPIIEKLSKLTSLKIDLCGIKDDGAMAFSKLKNLTHLNLYNSSLTTAGVMHLTDLENLTSLNLGANRYVGSINAQAVSALTKLTHLNELDLSDNNLDVETFAALSELVNLKKLTLDRIDNNDLLSENDMNEIPYQLTELKNLEVFSFAGNGFGPTLAHAVANLTLLRSLKINSNYIGEEGAESLTALTNLQTLKAVDSDFDDAAVATIAQMVNLERLDLSHNDSEYEGAAALANLPKLKNLVMSRNPIGNRGATALV